MNVITLSGRLTRDPEIRYTQSQKAVAGISIAVERRFRSEGQPEADFFNCTAFGKAAEVLEKYFRKGSRILLTGSLQNDTYTNREGHKVTQAKVIIEQLEFVDKKSESPAAPTVAEDPLKGFMDVPDDVDDEELPFN